MSRLKCSVRTTSAREFVMSQKNASGITTAVRTSMRQKVLKSPIYDDLANKFSEGLYDPEDNGVYENEVMKIKAFNQKQFDDVVELLAIINDEGSL